MKNKGIDISKIKLAQIRYFDAERKGSLIPEEKAYVFLVDIGGEYINLFNPSEILPVFGRAPYSNITMDGVEFGTKIVLLQGEIQDGPCYIIEKINSDDIFRKDEVTVEEIENYMIKSDRFFVDRIDIFERRKSIMDLGKRKKIRDDRVKLGKFEDYMRSQEKGYVYKKK